ncbi:MAG: hypothetical protein H0V27_01315 [Pyrinomonadaceae bacterium]|nr:hypothetical protein [Pyrinomonadaceae bacterium]
MRNSTESPEHMFANDAEIESIVCEFELCETPPARFNHRAHLTVAASYLLRLPFAEAHQRLRTNLLRFLKAHGVEEGYNETVTLFWLKRINKRIQNMEQNRGAYEIVNGILEDGGDSRIVYDYYTKEQLVSREARSGWVEPDLKRLD